MKPYVKKGFFIGCVPLLAWISFIKTLPYIYTPPALTEQKVEAYQAVVRFLKAHPSTGLVRLYSTQYSTVVIGNNGLPLTKAALHTYLQDEAAEKLIGLAYKFDEANCSSVWIEGNMLLFRPGHTGIIPPPAGVLYSMDGKDPNLVNSPYVSGARPFQRIAGSWYASRSLTRTGFFGASRQSYIPESLIDLTLKKPSGLK